MNVVHFCASIERGKDGVARVLEEIKRFTTERHISSFYVTAVSAGRTDVRSIKVPSVGIPKYDGYRLSYSSAEKITRRLEKENFAPDIVHLHSPCTLGLAGIAFARARGIPVVATYHTHFPMYLKYHGFSLLVPTAQKYLRYIYNRCDVVMVPSETLCTELRASGVRNVRFVPHGIDTSVFHPKFASFNRRVQLFGEQEKEKTLLLFVGRLVWEKNLRLLVQAIRPLLETRSNLALVIVGTGPAEGELRKMLPEAHFLGFRTGRELSEIYASSDIFVFSSDTETFGNVTLEALASGLPCVVADAGGSSDLIQDGKNGFKTHPQNPDDFRNAVLQLLDDLSLRHRMAEEAFHSAQQSSWDAVLERMLSVYEYVLGQNQRNIREQDKHRPRTEACGFCRFLPART
jgi:phosphatidylinositol alpha 1,6-mannosyltransferase